MAFWRPSWLHLGHRPPTTDPRNIGVTFVDVLFALVVGKILDASVDGHLPVAGKAQLVLSAILLITSWVGYHNSGNRSPYFLRFVNWPFVQFMIDIALVYVYWLTAATAEKAQPSAGFARVHPSAMPEALLIFLAACLYYVWDLVAWRVRVLGAYPERPIEHDVPGRRWVSAACVGVSAAVLVIVTLVRPRTTVSVVSIDVVLVAVLILYRLFKEWVTPETAFQPKGHGSEGSFEGQVG